MGQYPKFLRAHWKFLKTVVNKLFEFMHETHPGVQDMACDTFLKISNKCKRKFVVQQARGACARARVYFFSTVIAPAHVDTTRHTRKHTHTHTHTHTTQVGESQPFLSELLDGLTTTIQDLQPHQVHSFYESVGLMIGAEGERPGAVVVVCLGMHSLPGVGPCLAAGAALLGCGGRTAARRVFVGGGSLAGLAACAAQTEELSDAPSLRRAGRPAPTSFHQGHTLRGTGEKAPNIHKTTHTHTHTHTVLPACAADERKRNEYLMRLMTPPNTIWSALVHQARAPRIHTSSCGCSSCVPLCLAANTHTHTHTHTHTQAGQMPEVLKQPDAIKSITHVLATNVSVCTSLGAPYLHQMQQASLRGGGVPGGARACGRRGKRGRGTVPVGALLAQAASPASACAADRPTSTAAPLDRRPSAQDVHRVRQHDRRRGGQRRAARGAVERRQVHARRQAQRAQARRGVCVCLYVCVFVCVCLAAMCVRACWSFVWLKATSLVSALLSAPSAFSAPPKQTFVDKCDGEAMEELLATQYVPLLLDPLLGDYARSPADTRCARRGGVQVFKKLDQIHRVILRCRRPGLGGSARSYSSDPPPHLKHPPSRAPQRGRGAGLLRRHHQQAQVPHGGARRRRV